MDNKFYIYDEKYEKINVSSRFIDNECILCGNWSIMYLGSIKRCYSFGVDGLEHWQQNNVLSSLKRLLMVRLTSIANG